MASVRIYLGQMLYVLRKKSRLKKW